MGMKVEMVPVEKISPAPWNPREITEKARAALRRGLEEFDLVEPLIVAREDGELIGGHQRFSVLREMGRKTVPVVYVEGLTPERRKALAVLLNNTEAQGTWQTGGLAAILAELDQAADLTGFDAEFIAQLTGFGGTKAGEDHLDPKVIRPVAPWTWVLVAMPTERYVEVSAQIDAIAAKDPTFLCVQTSSHGPPENVEQPGGP